MEQAKAIDKDPSILFSEKLNVPQINRTKAGLELKSIFTNSTFEKSLGGYVKVSSIFQNTAVS